MLPLLALWVEAHGAARWVAFAVGRAQLLAGMNEIIVDVYSMQAALLMPPPTVPTPSAAATDARHPQAASSQPTDGDDAARATKRAKPSEPAPAATADTASHHSELKLHAARSDSIDSLFDGVFLSTAALPPSAPDAASRQLAVVPYDGARSDAKVELLRTTVKNLLEVRARPAGRLRGSTGGLDSKASLLALRLQADKILAQIESFWSYTEIMLEKATQMREHLEVFVDVNSHTSPSPGMHQRFCERINQYERFWNVLRALCDK